MLVSTRELLEAAAAGGYAIGGFNVYNLEWVQAVMAAAEATRSPVLIQILPGAFKLAGLPLVALGLEAARQATVPVNFHLDHHTAKADITAALELGVTSIMADGSHLGYQENVAFTRELVTLAHGYGANVEAELGLLSGSEDGYTVEAWQASLTDPDQAVEFVERTGVNSLAVCVGNVHGPYPGEPQLDFERLAHIHARVAVPLIMHGASGLPEAMIKRSIELGICKFNVNTEVRNAYVRGLHDHVTAGDQLPKDMIALMNAAIEAMQAVVMAKMMLFGCAGKA
ncbi:MAG: class II fructose-bisphosphate aldolase [Chloroflexi bacterium]|nr:class II fructose-bisphosphate aldolase [Chloroflexota bacterium]